MGDVRRTREVRLADRAQIANIVLFGAISQRELGEKMGLSQATINRELKILRDEWAASARQDIGEIVEKELKKLDVLESEAYEQWAKSKKDYEKTVIESGKGGKKTKKETGGQCGDPRYLTAILGIQERRAKLLGTDKPARLDLDHKSSDGSMRKDPDLSTLSTDELLKLKELSEKLNSTEG